jgi:outer membrane protein assembly factor BamB
MKYLRITVVAVFLLLFYTGLCLQASGAVTKSSSISVSTIQIENAATADLLVPEFSQIWSFQHTCAIRQAAPAVGDLDADGRLEVVINTGTYVDKVYALDALNGSVKWEAQARDGLGAPVLGDFNGDDLLDVIVPDGDNIKAYCGLNGSLIWNYPLSDTNGVTSSASLADIDGDNKLDVVFGGGDGRLYVLRNNGSLLWQFARHNSDTSSKPCAIGDLDADGMLEIVHYQRWFDWDPYGICYVLNAEDGSILWSKSYSEVEPLEAPVIGDIDGDGNMDVLVSVGSSNDGEVILYNGADGEVIWRYDRSPGTRTAPAIGDINNDGKMEVVFGWSLFVIALNGTDGTKIWENPHEVIVYSSPALADVNNDNILDVTIGGGYNSRKLYVFDGAKGNQIWSFTTPPIDHPTLQETMHASSTYWDIDNDGDLELLTQANGYTYVFNITGSGHRVYWQGFGGVADFTGTRCLFDVDPDYDTLSTFTESYLGTDPENPDSDSDTLLDNELYLYGTSPLSSDSDQDNMPDAWEIENGLNPLLDDSSKDPDSDGYTNIEEYQNGTNPFVFDPHPTSSGVAGFPMDLLLVGIGVSAIVLLVGIVIFKKRN